MISELFRVTAVCAVVLGVWVTSFQGRSSVIVAQRKACEQGKLGDIHQADSWWTAEERSSQTAYDRAADSQARLISRRAAETYGATAAWYEARSVRDCTKQYPDPGPLAIR